MKTRVIISACAAVILAVSCSQASDNGTAVKKDIAVQLYSVRSLVGAFGNNPGDYRPLLDTLSKMGYTAIEAASYADGKIYGADPAQFKADVEAAGLEVLSSHCNKYLSKEEIAMKYLVMPYLGVPSTLKELQAYCDYFNEVGRRCAESGIKFGYHNHSHEFRKVEGKEVMFDYMLQHTDPDYVFFEMDVYWAVIGDASPVDYFRKYPGRFKVLHIKDSREIGQSGMVGFDAIFGNAGVAGVENIVVEVERYSYDDILRSIKESIDYLEAAPFVPVSYGNGPDLDDREGKS